MDSHKHKYLEQPRNILQQNAGNHKVGLLFHTKILDAQAYERWLAESNNAYGSTTLFRVKVDPAPREGMDIDEIVITEHPSSQAALHYMSSFGDSVKAACSHLTILAIIPESPAAFRMVKTMSWLMQRFKGLQDKGTPGSHWTAENTAIWPDNHQMEVARNQNLDEPLFVYSLNKYKPVADYQTPDSDEAPISGQMAYDRYAKIAGFDLLRRGAFPVYGGKPVCMLEGSNDCMLADRWDKFVFVRYPQRRNLLSIIEGETFKQGTYHRDAGLERAAVFITSETNGPAKS